MQGQRSTAAAIVCRGATLKYTSSFGGPGVGARCGDGFFSTYKSPELYLSFTILVSLILVKYPDGIGPVNTGGTYGTVPVPRYTAQLNIHLIPHDRQARARHRPAPESGSLQSGGTWRGARLAAPRARAVGKGAGTSPWEDVVWGAA